MRVSWIAATRGLLPALLPSLPSVPPAHPVTRRATLSRAADTPHRPTCDRPRETAFASQRSGARLWIWHEHFRIGSAREALRKLKSQLDDRKAKHAEAAADVIEETVAAAKVVEETEATEPPRLRAV
ncbi:hypothetical protein GCM10010392_54570 [Streptomyces clavifer]|nr:hypothetical protein GCM10010392_54570 [Streptomyces clavifer]